MLAWLDLETTGLDASKELVLEVACVITDDALNEVARFHRVTSEARRCDFTRIDPYVLEMHVKNGLWNESLLAPDEYPPRPSSPIGNDGAALHLVDQSLALFLRQYCAEPGINWDPSSAGNKVGPQLAGSTISFDRAFLKEHLPRTHASLHYRNVDTSSFNEIARRFWPEIYAARPSKGSESAHRAMADVLESLEVMRYYVRKFGSALAVVDGSAFGAPPSLPTGEIGY